MSCCDECQWRTLCCDECQWRALFCDESQWRALCHIVMGPVESTVLCCDGVSGELYVVL